MLVDMSLSITHLGSGSRGNATLLESDGSKVLIDQGFSGRELEKRLARIDLHPSDIDAMLISHHHGDHGGGAGIVHRRWGVPIHCNLRTAGALGLDLVKDVELFESLQMIEFADDLSILPVPVPHDGADNVGFIASSKGERAAVVTDLGEWTDELLSHLRGCKHISIESNHDILKLERSPYSSSLKNRIRGPGGHLSNDQTGLLLAEVVSNETESIVLCHLSSENNKPHLAESTILYHIDEVFEGDIAISLQNGPEFTHWLGQTEKELNVLI